MVTFMGAGALGRALAGLLAASGERATLLTRPATARHLLAAGELCLDGVRPAAVPVGDGPTQPAGTVGVVDDPALLPATEALLFTTKGPQLPAAAAAVAARWRPGPGGWVGGLQNGVVKDDVLAAAFGAGRVVGAATVLGARRGADGATVVSGLGRTYLGEFAGAAGPEDVGTPSTGSGRVAELHAAFTRAGLPCDVLPDIRQLLWMKCCNAIGAFGVSALTRLASTVMMREEPLVAAYLSLVREAAAVAAAEGVEVADYPDLPVDRYLSAAPEETVASILAVVRALPADAPRSYSSMAQDVLLGRQTEVEEVFGDLVRRAARHAVPAPRLGLVHQLVAGIDRAGAN